MAIVTIWAKGQIVTPQALVYTGGMIWNQKC